MGAQNGDVVDINVNISPVVDSGKLSQSIAFIESQLEQVKKHLESSPKNDAMAEEAENIRNATKAIADQIEEYRKLESAKDAANKVATDAWQRKMQANNPKSSNYVEDEAERAAITQASREATAESKRLNAEYEKGRDLLAQQASEYVKISSAASAAASVYSRKNEIARPDTKDLDDGSADRIAEKYQNIVSVIKEWDEAIIATNGDMHEMELLAQTIFEFENGKNIRASEIADVAGIVNARYQELHAIEDAKKAEDGKSDATKRSADNIKDATSQTYYLLRATKMAAEQIRRIDANVEKFTKTLISGVQGAASAIAKMTLGMASFKNNTKQATREHEGLKSSLKDGVKMILAYGLGLRSLFAIARRLRKYVGTGLQAMSKQFNHVNNQMSSTIASLNQMKASLATVVQPILGALAPALSKLAELFSKAAVAVGSFFAVLTGQKFVYKAVRAQYDYAASLDKSSKSAKKMNDELDEMLGHYDELNVIDKNDNKNSGGGGGGGGTDPTAGYSYEKVPLNESFAEAAKKVKKILEQLFDPLQKAWDKKGKYVMDSWKSALSNVISLLGTIGKDFLTVWQQPASIKIWEDLFEILGGIGEIIANIAANFEDAWVEGEKGKRIFELIRDIIGIVVSKINECVKATVEWAKTLNFNPILEATVRFLEKIKPLIQTIADIVGTFYTTVILPFRKFLIEEGLPQLLDILGELAEKINKAIPKKEIEEFMPVFEKFLEKGWQALLIVIEDIGNAIAKFLGSDTLKNFIDLLKDWMENADPKTMAKDIESFAKALLIFWGAVKLLKGITTIAQNVLTFANLFGRLSTVIGGGEAGGGFLGILGKLGTTLANILPKIAAFFTGPVGIVTLILLAIPTIALIIDNLEEISKGFKSFGEKLYKFMKDLGPKIVKGFSKAGEKIGKAVGKFFKWIWDQFTDLPNKDWKQIGEDILLGILHIFFAVNELISTIKKAVTAFFKSFWKGLTSAFGISSPAKKMKPIGENILKGILKGITDALSNIGNWVKKNIFNKITKAIKDAFGIANGVAKNFITFGKSTVSALKDGITDKYSALKDKIKGVWGKIKDGASSKLKGSIFEKIGKNTISKIKEGISSKYTTLKDTIKGFWTKIKTSATDVLKESSFVSIGKSLMTGIKKGIGAGWDAIKSWVSSAWGKVTKSAKDTYDQNSPSKVFAQIGEYNMLGLAEGMEDGEKSIEKEDFFGDLFDADNMDTIYDRTVSTFEKISSAIKAITKDLSQDVGGQLQTMTNFATMQKLSYSIATPAIAQGKVLPTSGNFATDNDLYDKLPKIISEAVDDAFASAINSAFNNSRNNSPIMLQLNSKVLAQAVWDEADKKYKQTGRRM